MKTGNKPAHHIKSIELFEFLKVIDFELYDNSFCWKSGGDGDNGEILMHQLDAYFAEKERTMG